ncbi:MAG TPA: tetratricopeptide repeat protein [Armatimonadota bacterium]
MTMLIIALAVLGWGLPVFWLLHLWYDGRRVNSPWAITVFFVHLSLYILLFEMGGLRYLLSYCGLALLLVSLSLPLRRLGDRRLIRALDDEETTRLQRIVTRHPENVAAHVALAEAYITNRRYAEAVAEYQRVTELDPEQAQQDRRKIAEAQRLQALAATRLHRSIRAE